ncbi:Signal transducer protein (Fragment) [Madurella fahalii]|uniref:Signal transducer protein n=1 Tax=Madurella fahalii TaxID=1157608 RepID=A0ABQ0FXH4_9PEZI
MDPQSPPKRMTRARAAAKTAEPGTKTTRIVTAAAKAKSVRSTAATTTATTTTRTATKRKSPSDEDDDEDLDELVAAEQMSAITTKPTRGRGRPKKVVIAEPEPEPQPAPASAPVRSRGRPKKAVEPVAEAPTRATRTTRAKKADEAEGTVEPVKKTTRGRPATSAATTAPKSLAKPAVKKTVKFEEPEKENIAPSNAPTTKRAAKTSAPATAGGLRGKPVRKAATSRTARSTRSAAPATTASEKEERPMPLSPKKINQLAANRAESDDELGMDEKVPVRRLRKAPVKAATKSSTAPELSVSVSENDENASISRPETDLALMLGTPAKRLPPSPWKGSIMTPARRVEGLFGPPLTQTANDNQASQSPTKTGLLQSPAKRQPLALNPLGAGGINGPQMGVSPLKMSFLSSPAKRSISPIKPLPPKIEEEESMNQTPAPKPTLLASPLPAVSGTFNDEDIMTGAGTDSNAMPESPTRPRFPGRLSAVLPRHADPALTPPMLSLAEELSEAGVEDVAVEEAAENENAECLGEPMVLDDAPDKACKVESASTTPPSSPPATANPMFGLRQKDLDPYDDATDSDSDNELPRQGRFTSACSVVPATPRPAAARTPSTQNRQLRSSSRSTAKRARMDDKFGFTPLAQQLSGWTAGPSPRKAKIATPSPTANGQAAASTPTEAAQNTFFEDEMHVRPEAMEIEGDAVGVSEENSDPILEDLSFTEEDMALAAEAHEMSLMEPELVLNTSNSSHDDTISEASQEYGDENAIPIDPNLVSNNEARSTAIPPVTPQRVIHREVHTVAKVPLKPADDSTSRPTIKKRGHSISRLPASRPTEGLIRNATVISYSPTKGADVESPGEEQEEQAESAPPVTPQKSDIWSTIGTPGRTPRRDLNPALLRGAVVFVDVHTSEGADASGIFVELLTQMGARCVKNWTWNPSGSQPDGADSRIGITHVVYKDGGKRTLEKVRESGGVVQCVGVSWVLDCERENEWLDEAPYYIDTSLVPRGGARRRKSMEPRAIGNLNSMLVPSPVRTSSFSRGCRTAPTTPAHNRRASALWIRTPDESRADESGHNSENSDDDGDSTEDHGHQWSAPLTPVPKTPAPEAIARFVANISPGSESPSTDDSEDPLTRDIEEEDRDDNSNENNRQAMLLRTCPPKRTTFVEPAQGILNREKDERVLMRLMAARRKSLQFAPKVGSPLAKSWR